MKCDKCDDEATQFYYYDGELKHKRCYKHPYGVDWYNE